jgi:hypothetical protein
MFVMLSRARSTFETVDAEDADAETTPIFAADPSHASVVP